MLVTAAVPVYVSTSTVYDYVRGVRAHQHSRFTDTVRVEKSGLEEEPLEISSSRGWRIR